MYDKCYFCLDQLPKLKKESTASFFVNFGGAGVQKSRPTLLYNKHGNLLRWWMSWKQTQFLLADWKLSLCKYINWQVMNNVQLQNEYECHKVSFQVAAKSTRQPQWFHQVEVEALWLCSRAEGSRVSQGAVAGWVGLLSELINNREASLWSAIPQRPSWKGFRSRQRRK